MATQKKSASRKSAGSKRTGSSTKAAKKATSNRKSANKSAAKKSAPRSGTVRKGVETSAATAKQTGVKRTNVTQYEQRKTASGKTARKKMTPGQAKAKKETLIKQKRSTGEGATCWPGYERVPGKEPGTKGSCKPKPNQTPAERKEDAREAAGSKLRKAGGNKARANHAR